MATRSAPAPAAPQAPQPLCDNLCWLLSRASYTLTTELAKMVGLDKTTMVVTLDELEAAGLAERRPSPNDRRARVIAVTKAGARKLREAEAIGDAIRDDVLSVLPAGERKAFLGALTKLVGDRLAEPVPCAHPVRRRAPRA